MKAADTNVAAFRRDGIPMILNRRTLLAAAAGLAAIRPGVAQEAPAALAAYEHDTGGRVGLYAENLATGSKLAWAIFGLIPLVPFLYVLTGGELF